MALTEVERVQTRATSHDCVDLRSIEKQIFVSLRNFTMRSMTTFMLSKLKSIDLA